MLNKIATRIQTRLSRKGLKVVLGNIKDYLKANVIDIENITKEEENNVTEYFLASASQLSVVDDLTTEDINNVDTVNTLSIQDIDSSELYLEEDVDDIAIAQNQLAPLATANKNELVASTADQMGIVLDASEISLIAENINHSSDDFDQDIDVIKSAIMAFVEHKAMVNQSKINQMIGEVRQVVIEKNSENSQLLTDGLRSINQDIQEANKQFKSNVKQCLSAFNIPSLKAG
jgi:hypothetical protein